MKVLFFLVALANIGLFMWEFKHGAFVTKSQDTSPAINEWQEPILLVSELETVPTPATDTTPTPQASSPVASSCFEVGPFADDADYQAWLALMADFDADINDSTARQPLFFVRVKGEAALVRRLGELQSAYPQWAVKPMGDNGQACW
ncbi:MAG: hypothetical protein NTV43_08135 [Methylococcales bacterium]|nr:hypothetical protein [Methylococcales bacterium]